MTTPANSETPETPAVPAEKRKGAKPLVLAKSAARYEKAVRKLERARAAVRDAEEAAKRLTEAEAEYREAKEEFDALVEARG